MPPRIAFPLAPQNISVTRELPRRLKDTPPGGASRRVSPVVNERS